MKMTKKFPNLFAVSILLMFGLVSGCTSVNKITLQSIHSDPENEDDFVKVDLVRLVDPREAEDDGKTGSGSTSVSQNRSVEVAFQQFYLDKNAPKDPERRLAFFKQRRNAVQARFIAASNVECGRYRSRLLRLQSGVNFGLSTLTTTLAAASAIVSGGSAPALAGGAAVVNSTRSSFNENYFRQLAMEQITRAIQASREEFLSEIAERRALPIEEYTVEFAVGDAMQYHFRCSLISGLEYTGEAIANARDPGINRTMRMLNNSGLTTPLSLDPKKVKRSNSPFGDISTPVDIVNVDPPIQESDQPVGSVTAIERSMKLREVKQLQRALCLNDTKPGSERRADGAFGTETRAEIESFQNLRGSQLPDEDKGFLLPGTVANIKRRGDCDAQYKSYFEKHSLNNPGKIKKFQADLITKLKAIGVVDVDLSGDNGKLGPKTREAIKKLKEKLKEEDNNVEINDFIDVNVLNEVRPADD